MKALSAIAGIMIAATLTACSGGGGGGGGTSGGGGGGQQTTQTVISGVASKGIITGGTVKVFALNTDGTKGSQIGSDATTNAKGEYSVNVGQYTGPVLVEVSGSYTDEATGTSMSVPASAPLRAALPNAANDVTIAVTPLTELAVQKAGTLLPQNISTANLQVSNAFKVDIISTTPVAPVASSLGNASQEQKDYTLLLAAVSQQMNTSSVDLSTVLSTLSSGISSSGISKDTMTTIATAAQTFASTSGISATPSSLQNVGKISVSLQNNSGRSVNGIQATVTFPTGASLPTESGSGAPLSGVTSKLATGISALNFVPATATTPATLTIAAATTNGIAAGEILTIEPTLASSLSVIPTASAYNVTVVKIIDFESKDLTGASLTLK